MKPSGIIFFITVMICAPCVQKTTAGADQKWTIKDIIDIAQAHSAQINDIQYTYAMLRVPTADPNYIRNYEIAVIWFPEKGWEKCTTEERLSTSPDEVYHIVNAWDGEYNRYNIALVRKGGQSSRKEGIVSSRKRMFSGREPLRLLNIKGGSYSHVSLLLSGKDVLVEGVETIDSHETALVSVNRIFNLPRKDSLVTKYWLDMKCGALPRRTELYHKGELKRIVSDVTISEIKPWLFFPTGCTVTFGGESEGIWSQSEIMYIQVDVNSINLNQGLQKKDFYVEFEHGQAVTNLDTGIVYYEGIDTSSSLEELLNTLDQLVDETFGLSESSDPNSPKTLNP